MKRFAGILTLVAWLAAVTWYWRENVPLVPTKSADLPTARNLSMLSPTGELVVSSYQSANRAMKRTGPFEFWSFPELKKVREAFRNTDEVIQYPNYRTGDLLIRRDGSLLVCNLYSDTVLATLSDMPDVRAFRVLQDRQAILIQNGPDLQLYEFNKSEPIWTATNVQFSGDVAGEILIGRKLSETSPRSFAPGGATAVILGTGDIDHRFDQTVPVNKIDLSPDGRWALVFPTNGQPVLCDAATGKALWNVPAGRVDWWFGDSSDVIYGHRNDDARTLIRRRASDGELLTPLDGPAFRVHQQQVTADGRFAVVDANTKAPQWVSQWYNQANYLSDSWRDRLYSMFHRQRSKVIDHQTGHLIGYLPDYAGPRVLKGNLGFVTITPGRITYYALPPRRNYAWLLGWLLLPPTALVLLSQTWKRLRRRRTGPPIVKRSPEAV